ncbi:DUF2125 domain-containing protein [Phaeobacter sp. B1627]|uniref:DUF2125 domain-containing protein n=1 Tax=Phaeobacter sp. B1627 TaxID=2583809 RepID=UPI00111A1B2F|nr:DUF2125 domain-containing protein [Phaeobacter sp. B1627]TNJ46283.1 DUF2125 domain-containing protein [Phaeobacter sp. B1627]
MSVSPLRGLGLVAPIFLLAQAAHADLSAEDVWSDWKAYLADVGYEVTGAESRAGVALVVSDIQMSMTTDASRVSLDLGKIEFVENGDGTVNVLLPPQFPMAFNVSGNAEDASGTLLYSHDGSPMVVSGDTSRMEYVYNTAVASLRLEDLLIDGKSEPFEGTALNLTLNDVTSDTVMRIDDIRSYTQVMSIASLVYDVVVKDPEDQGTAQFSGLLQGFKSTGDMTIPTVEHPADMAAMISAGLSYAINFTVESGNSNIIGSDDGDNITLQTSSQGGEFNVNLSSAGMAYDVVQTDATLSVMGTDIPFPIALSMAEMGMNLAVPLSKSDEEQDFALGIALRDFAVPDMVWGLIDPSGDLPHDPANLILDLAGKVKLFFDLTDETQMAAVEQGNVAPGEVNSVDVNQLLFSVAGAELTGTGAFTFDNTDFDSFDGIPAPSGEANLKLVGANTLVDKLIGIGLLSEDDAMGARMMMGMFSVPGAGEDTLTSKIEITEDGKLLANGQRLK